METMDYIKSEIIISKIKNLILHNPSTFDCSFCLTCVVRCGYGGEGQTLCQEARCGYRHHRCGEGLCHLGSGRQPLGVLPKSKTTSEKIQTRNSFLCEPVSVLFLFVFIRTCWEWQMHTWLDSEWCCTPRKPLSAFLMTCIKYKLLGLNTTCKRITSKAIYSTVGYKKNWLVAGHIFPKSYYCVTLTVRNIKITKLDHDVNIVMMAGQYEWKT